MKTRLATANDHELLRLIVAAVMADTAPDDAKLSAFDPALYTGGNGPSFAVIIEDTAPVGCFTAHALEQGAYCIHTNLLPSCRGASAIRAAAKALEFAFTRTDADYLTTMIPRNNRPALWFAHAMGFRDAFRRKALWLKDGTRHDVQYLRMDIDDWIQQLTLVERGQAFHRSLADLGGHIDHEPDLVHDAYVGAAWAMTAGGQIDKGFRVYNRWARTAGFKPYAVLSEQPLRLDIGSHVLAVKDDSFVLEEA